MKRSLLAIAMLTAGFSHAQSIGIASGQETGTNWPMAENIKATCSTPQHPINNVKSDGSLDNIFKIYGNRNVQYGIIQEDALVYQKGIDPKMMDRILMVFPFFSTEIHLVVAENSPIKSFNDLAGRRVIEGPEGSGTWVSVQVIKATTGIKWDAYKMSQADGLKAVQTGMADAEFIVAGQPIGMLSKASGIRLIPISHPQLDNFKYYTKTMLPSGTYPFQKTAVNTYKVDNVLATFAFKNQYQKEIGDLVTCLARNIEQLQTTGHDKWKDVNITDIDRIKWPSHPAAVAAIKRAAKSQ